MEHEDIKVLIVKRGGFQTLEQIKAEFENEDMEVLEAKLTFLVEKNRIRKVPYQSPTGHSFLFYMPRQ